MKSTPDRDYFAREALSVSIPLFKPSEQGSNIVFLGSKMEDGAVGQSRRAPVEGPVRQM